MPTHRATSCQSATNLSASLMYNKRGNSARRTEVGKVGDRDRSIFLTKLTRGVGGGGSSVVISL